MHTPLWAGWSEGGGGATSFSARGLWERNAVGRLSATWTKGEMVRCAVCMLRV